MILWSCIQTQLIHLHKTEPISNYLHEELLRYFGKLL